MKSDRVAIGFHCIIICSPFVHVEMQVFSFLIWRRLDNMAEMLGGGDGLILEEKVAKETITRHVPGGGDGGFLIGGNNRSLLENGTEAAGHVEFPVSNVDGELGMGPFGAEEGVRGKVRDGRCIDAVGFEEGSEEAGVEITEGRV